MNNMTPLGLALTNPAPVRMDWHVALVRLALVSAPLALLIAIAHAL